MQKFQEIVFIQGEEAEELLEILKSRGESAALQYLVQWDYGEGDGDIHDENPAGSNDSTYSEGCYIISYSTTLGYIGLCKIIEAKQEAS